MWEHRHDPADIVRRLKEVTREYVQIVHDTAQISTAIMYALVAVFVFNLAVSTAALGLISLQAWMINSIEEYNRDEAFVVTALVIAGFYALRVMLDNPFEYVRDWFAETYFRKPLYMQLSRMGFGSLRSLPGDTSPQVRHSAPARILRGRESWMILVEFPIRELTTIVAVIPAFAELNNHAGAAIAVIAFVSIPLGVAATMAKDYYLKRLFADRQQAEYAVLKNEECEALDPGHMDMDRYMDDAVRFAELHRRARVWSSLWDNLGRDAVFNVMLGLALLIGAHQVVYDGLHAGDFAAIIGYCEFMRRPVQAVFSMQAEMQVRREAIGEYCKLLRRVDARS
jgi:ABC-type multidrug transport system fused ATPase/permease subunit